MKKELELGDWQGVLDLIVATEPYSTDQYISIMALSREASKPSGTLRGNAKELGVLERAVNPGKLDEIPARILLRNLPQVFALLHKRVSRARPAKLSTEPAQQEMKMPVAPPVALEVATSAQDVPQEYKTPVPLETPATQESVMTPPAAISPEDTQPARAPRSGSRLADAMVLLRLVAKKITPDAAALELGIATNSEEYETLLRIRLDGIK